MMEDPRSITSGTHLLFVAKYIERIGDHTTSVARNVHILIHGVAPDGERPKGGASFYNLDAGPKLEGRVE